MLLNFVAYNRVPLVDIPLPLPPAVEDGRKAALASCRATIQSANNSVEIESTNRGRKLREKDEIITQINQNWALYQNKLSERRILSADIKTQPKFIFGNEIFNFDATEEIVVLDCPIQPFRYFFFAFVKHV